MNYKKIWDSTIKWLYSLTYSFLAQCQVFCVERMVINYTCIDLRKYLMYVSVVQFHFSLSAFGKVS